MLLVMMSVDGMTVMDQTMIAIGTGATANIDVAPTDITLKDLGTRQILHAVLVVTPAPLKPRLNMESLAVETKYVNTGRRLAAE
jgi:hypothetical protein